MDWGEHPIPRSCSVSRPSSEKSDCSTKTYKNAVMQRIKAWMPAPHTCWIVSDLLQLLPFERSGCRERPQTFLALVTWYAVSSCTMESFESLKNLHGVVIQKASRRGSRSKRTQLSQISRYLRTYDQYQDFFITQHGLSAKNTFVKVSDSMAKSPDDAQYRPKRYEAGT